MMGPVRGITFWDTLWQDIRFGCRTLRRSPGYTAAAISVLALGIGANTAMFSVIRGVLLAPLPFPNGHELVLVQQSAPASNVDDAGVSIQELDDYRSRLQSVRDLVEFHSMSFVLLNQGEPDRIQAAVVSANFFDMLGVRPRLGRTFRKGDDDIGAEAVLVLSHEYLAVEVRRRGRRDRPRAADEQPAAHGRRRAAAVPAVPGRERRLHVHVRLPVPGGVPDQSPAGPSLVRRAARVRTAGRWCGRRSRDGRGEDGRRVVQRRACGRPRGHWLTRPDGTGGVAPGGAHRRQPAAAARPRRVHAADPDPGLRQRREPRAGALDAPRPRARVAHGARRRPRPVVPAARHREPHRGGGRGRARPRPRVRARWVCSSSSSAGSRRARARSRSTAACCSSRSPSRW